MFSFFLRSQDIIAEDLNVQSAKGFLRMAGLLSLSLFFKVFTSYYSDCAFYGRVLISLYPFDGKIKIKVLVLWQNSLLNEVTCIIQ